MSLKSGLGVILNALKYAKFSEIEPSHFIPLLNNHRIRKHLIEHELFDANTVQEWMNEKIKVDSTAGCKVRAIILDDQLSGWCGIQLEDKKYEVAIIIDDKLWGLAKNVFRDVMRWAKKLGHQEIYVHLLDTRPEYGFLRKMSTNVRESELLGRKFKTYRLTVQ